MLRYIAKFQTKLASVMDAREEGATAVEYGLMVALIAGVIAVTVGFLVGQITAAFQKVLTSVTAANA
jgi:pilus assembly protein Flp/PilA